MARPRSASRDQLVDSARTLLRRQGFQGTGLAQIVAASGAPRGSTYFLFPGGKEELAAAAVTASGADLAAFLRAAAERAPDVDSWFAEVVGHLADQLAGSGYTDGCPVTTVTLDSVPASAALTEACRTAYQDWLAALTDGLAAFGVPEKRAPGLAVLALAAVEGALVLCRALGTVEPLHEVRRQVSAVAAAG